MTEIEGPIRFLVNFGLVDVILPLILVYVITFGLLERNNVLKDRRSNIITSLSLAFIAVLTVNVLQILNVIVRYVAVLLVTGILIALIYGMVGAKIGKPNKILTGLLVFLFGMTAIFALTQTGLIDSSKFFSRILFPFIVLVAIMSVVIYYITKKSEKKKLEKKEPPEGKGIGEKN